MENTEITREELEAVKYGDLKEKFTELGIESVWKNGVKKGDLIEDALVKLAELKENVSEKELEGKEVVTEEEEKARLLAEAQAEEAAEKEKVQLGSEDENPTKEGSKNIGEEVVEKVVVSRETLEKRKLTIEANLAHGVPGHRENLLKQLEKTQALLDALDKKE